MELADYYINRNFEIIKAYKTLVGEGEKTRNALQIVANQFKVSFGLVSAVIYNDGYPYRAEAYKKYEDEQRR